MGPNCRTLIFACCVALLGAAAGCAPGGFDVTVEIDEDDAALHDRLAAGASIEVNVVGVNDAELSCWQQMSVTDYWSPDSAVRVASLKHVMRFSQGQPAKQILKLDDPIWRQWRTGRQASHLVVLAYLPWVREDAPGSADRRRIILPLDAGRWAWDAWGRRNVPVRITTGGLVCSRQPSAKGPPEPIGPRP